MGANNVPPHILRRRLVALVLLALLVWYTWPTSSDSGVGPQASALETHVGEVAAIHDTEIAEGLRSALRGLREDGSKQRPEAEETGEISDKPSPAAMDEATVVDQVILADELIVETAGEDIEVHELEDISSNIEDDYVAAVGRFFSSNPDTFGPPDSIEPTYDWFEGRRYHVRVGWRKYLVYLFDELIVSVYEITNSGRTRVFNDDYKIHWRRPMAVEELRDLERVLTSFFTGDANSFGKMVYSEPRPDLGEFRRFYVVTELDDVGESGTYIVAIDIQNVQKVWLLPATQESHLIYER